MYESGGRESDDGPVRFIERGRDRVLPRACDAATTSESRGCAQAHPRLRDAGGVGERKVALVVERLGGNYRDLSGAALGMVVEGIFTFH